MKILYTKLRDVKSPGFGTSRAAGIDFFIPNDFETTSIYPGHSVLIPSGIKISIREDNLSIPTKNYALVALNKSGVSIKKGLAVGAQLVDIDYTGEIHLHLYNTGTSKIEVSPGEKIVQFIVTEVFNPDIVEISNAEWNNFLDVNSERGEGMAGSTGTH